VALHSFLYCTTYHIAMWLLVDKKYISFIFVMLGLCTIQCSTWHTKDAQQMPTKKEMLKFNDWR
jgi:hypothetical protein